MKRWKVILVALGAAVATVVLAEGVLSPRVGLNASLAWDAPTTNADGTPCTDLAGFKLALSFLADDLRVSGTPIKQVTIGQPTFTEYELQGFLSDQPDGEYRLWVLAYDLAGNDSEWSEPLPIYWDAKKPGKPGRVRILTP